MEAPRAATMLLLAAALGAAALAAPVLLRSVLARALPALATAAVGGRGQRLLLLLSALLTAIVSLGFGTYAVGGSDSFDS